jgi:hypothetical protein
LEQLAGVRDDGLARFHLEWIGRLVSQCQIASLEDDSEDDHE